jgi:hypothetical protein
MDLYHYSDISHESSNRAHSKVKRIVENCSTLHKYVSIPHLLLMNKCRPNINLNWSGTLLNVTPPPPPIWYSILSQERDIAFAPCCIVTEKTNVNKVSTSWSYANQLIINKTAYSSKIHSNVIVKPLYLSIHSLFNDAVSIAG